MSFEVSEFFLLLSLDWTGCVVEVVATSQLISDSSS
nr:MAG TPA: hypothetical protein [Caudoviricetes sp.]